MRAGGGALAARARRFVVAHVACSLRGPPIGAASGALPAVRPGLASPDPGRRSGRVARSHCRAALCAGLPWTCAAMADY